MAFNTLNYSLFLVAMLCLTWGLARFRMLRLTIHHLCHRHNQREWDGIRGPPEPALGTASQWDVNGQQSMSQ